MAVVAIHGDALACRACHHGPPGIQRLLHIEKNPPHGAPDQVQLATSGGRRQLTGHHLYPRGIVLDEIQTHRVVAAEKPGVVETRQNVAMHPGLAQRNPAVPV